MQMQKIVHRFFATSIIVSLAMGGSIAMAQICDRSGTPETFSTTVLTADINAQPGTFSDLKNNLNWQRCFYGQTWDTTQQLCAGNPQKLNWSDALVAANASGWRLPNIKELFSILDFQCFAPPLHPEAFPDAPGSLSSGMWTSSPVQTSISIQDLSTSAWIIDLGHGRLRRQKVGELNFVLLVRDI